MNIITRFKDIMSANINALLEKCEDPEKMIDEYMRQVVEELAEVKEETAKIMAEEKRAKKLLDDNAKEIEKYVEFAKKAIAAGNDGDAKVFLEKKMEFEKLNADLQKAYDMAKANADKMKEMHDKLTKDLQSLEMRRKNVKAKVAVAKTQEKINKVSGSMKTAGGSMKAFEKMEEKAARMLEEANAMAELDHSAFEEVQTLEEKYSGDDQAIDDELAKLKASMGM